MMVMTMMVVVSVVTVMMPVVSQTMMVVMVSVMTPPAVMVVMTMVTAVVMATTVMVMAATMVTTVVSLATLAIYALAVVTLAVMTVQELGLEQGFQMRALVENWTLCLVTAAILMAIVLDAALVLVTVHLAILSQHKAGDRKHHGNCENQTSHFLTPMVRCSVCSIPSAGNSDNGSNHH